MNTQEILDLEKDLNGIGCAKKGTYFILEPENWENESHGRFHRFDRFVYDQESEFLFSKGFSLSLSTFSIPTQSGKFKAKRTLCIKGLILEGKIEAERIAEKYGVEKIFYSED